MKGVFAGPVARIMLAVFASIWFIIELSRGNLMWTLVAAVLVALNVADLLLKDRPPGEG